MNRGIEKQLRALVGTGTWLEVYTDASDLSKFVLGQTVAMDGRWIMLAAYDQDGEDEGYTLRLIEDILLFVEESMYIRRVRALRGNRADAGAPMTVGEGGILPSVLDYAAQSGALVAVEVANSGYTDARGRVRRYDADAVEILQFDAFGASDGVAYIPVEALTRVECDGADERRIARLVALQP